MASKLVTQLAKHTQALLNPISYGVLRKKLDKKNFSEIALYAAVARHCEENDLVPFDMANDMLELIKGCAENEFFIRIDDRFPYLRRQFHELHHGDTDKGEVKSAEQRGQFLCNTCYLVKKQSEKSGKSYRCKYCVNDKSKESQQRRKNIKKDPIEDVPKPTVVPPATVTPKETATEPAPEKDQVTNETPKGVNIDALSERKQKEEEAPSSSELFKITQIIGDGDNTEFNIVCRTQDLPTVVGILKELQ